MSPATMVVGGGLVSLRMAEMTKSPMKSLLQMTNIPVKESSE